MLEKTITISINSKKQLLATVEANTSDHHGIVARSWTHDQLLMYNNRLLIGSSPLTNLFFCQSMITTTTTTITMATLL
jgi:hypothetical protein